MSKKCQFVQECLNIIGRDVTYFIDRRVNDNFAIKFLVRKDEITDKLINKLNNLPFVTGVKSTFPGGGDDGYLGKSGWFNGVRVFVNERPKNIILKQPTSKQLFTEQFDVGGVGCGIVGGVFETKEELQEALDKVFDIGLKSTPEIEKEIDKIEDRGDSRVTKNPILTPSSFHIEHDDLIIQDDPALKADINGNPIKPKTSTSLDGELMTIAGKVYRLNEIQ